jgi:hypothetical protein
VPRPAGKRKRLAGLLSRDFLTGETDLPGNWFRPFRRLNVRRRITGDQPNVPLNAVIGCAL